MKFIKHSLLLMLALFVVACGGSSEKTNADSEADKKAVEEKEHKEREARGFHSYDPDFQTLMVSYDGILRGIHIMDTKNGVKMSEEGSYQIDYDGKKMEMPRAVLAEEAADKLVYKLKMTDKEDATINYVFTEDKLTSINMRIHVSSNEEFEAMEAELVQFFTHKFDAPDIIEGRKEVWKLEGEQVHEVDIIEEQEGDKYYITVEIK